MFRRHKHPQEAEQTRDPLGFGSCDDDDIWYRPAPRSICGEEGSVSPPSGGGENALLSAYVASVEGCSLERPEHSDSTDSNGSGHVSLSPEDEPHTDLQTLIKRKAWKFAIKRLAEHPMEAMRYQSVPLYEMSVASDDDSQRALPIHHAMTLHPPSIVVEKIIKAYPDCARMIDEKYGRLPLHFGCIDSAGVNCLSVLVKAFPEGAMVKDNSGGRLPLHYVCIWGTLPEVTVILNAYPAGRFAKDGEGKTPLILAQNSGNTNKDSIVHVLQTRLKDGNGRQNVIMRSNEVQGDVDYSPRDERECRSSKRRLPRPRNKSPTALTEGNKVSVARDATDIGGKPPTGLETAAGSAVARYTNMSGQGRLPSRECSPSPPQRVFRDVSSITLSDRAQTGGALCATNSGSENRDQHCDEQHQQVVDVLINELLSQKVELSNHLSDVKGVEQEIEKLEVRRNALAGKCAKFEQTTRSKASSVASSRVKLDELNQQLEALFVTIEKEKSKLKKAEQDLNAGKQKILGHRKQIAAIKNEKLSLVATKESMLEACARTSQRVEQIDAEIQSLIAVHDLVRREEEGNGCYLQHL